MKAVFLLLIVIAFSDVPASAQAGVTVSGTVEDQSRAVIRGGKITLADKSTGHARQTTSDGEGRFTFANVPPGEYALQSEAEGFKRFETVLSVHSQAITNVRVTMPISSTEEVVDVSASRERPDAPENNADSVNVNADFIAGLPSQSQDIVPVVSNFLSPAAQGIEGPSIVVDGVESSGLIAPTDAIKRIYVNKDPYSTEFRRPG